ncbi:MAG: hypothetical protein HY897_07620 [Deltaproteobacteria bacterium]|nr:hypothetical protein [Deltaproteobacteria bacterium]
MTAFFGKGVLDPWITAEHVALLNGSGAAVPATIRRTHWSNGTGTSRLLIVDPETDLAFDSLYTAKIAAQMPLVDGTATTAEVAFQVLAWCAPENESACAADDAGGGSDGGADATGGIDAGHPPADAAPEKADSGDPGASGEGEGPSGCECAALGIP